MENTPERKVLRGGFYFSVWKKQADGVWKVILDMGVGTPVLERREGGEAVVAPQVKLKTGGKSANRETSSGEINRLEQKFSELSEKNAAEAYGKFARDDARLHRFRILPVLGKQNVLRHVAENEARSSWKMIKSGVSEAGDFAWSYGTYKILQEARAEDKTKEGYYLRVWRIADKNIWTMVAEVTNPLKLQ
jgi:ketosteroid isomerase-like protein